MRTKQLHLHLWGANLHSASGFLLRRARQQEPPQVPSPAAVDEQLPDTGKVDAHIPISPRRSQVISARKFRPAFLVIHLAPAECSPESIAVVYLVGNKPIGTYIVE